MRSTHLLTIVALGALGLVTIGEFLARQPSLPDAARNPLEARGPANPVLPKPQAPIPARFAAAAVAGGIAGATAALANPGAKSEDELRAIALERRGKLLELIQADPAAALACRLTYSQRMALPASVVALLEEPIDAFGRLEVIAVCGQETGGTERFVHAGGTRRRAFIAGSRVAAVSQERLPVHGIAVEGFMAVAAEPYRIPDAGEIAAEPSVEAGIEVFVGDERRVFAAKEELDEWADGTRAAETVLPSVFGDRKILFVMVDFSDAPGAPTTAAEILKSMDAVNAYYREMSANRLSFTTTVLPAVLRAPQTKAAYSADSESYLRLMTETLASLRDYEAQSGSRGTYAQANYQHVAVVFLKVAGFVATLTPMGWSGRADQPGSRLWFNGDWSSGVIAHELGHNFGLSHAYAWKPGAGSPVGVGTHVEYGDPFEVMGVGKSSINGHFCTPKKRALGFIADTNLVSVRTSGEYRIFRHDGEIGSRVVGLKIDAGTAYDYWIEYRKQVPDGLADYADAMATGVQLRWNKLPSFTQAGATGTYLLDMTPGSAGDMKDSMLTLGNSFVDPAYGIRITPLRTGTSSEGDWIEVAVALGDRPGNRAPAVQSAAAAETAFARVPVNLTAKASDADGDTVLYQWDFGDGRPVYTTAASVQKQWVAGGTYPVLVRAFDIYGGESRQTIQVLVSDPLTDWTRVPGAVVGDDLRAVCFGGGRFVAVGPYFTYSSSDGVRWSRGTNGFTTISGRSVAAGAGRFVAVGANYSFATGTFYSGLASSSDGLSWSATSTVRTEILNAVCFGTGRFVAVGESGAIWSSADGQAWSFQQLNSRKHLEAVSFNGSEFMAVGDAGTAIYSRDGSTWYDASLSDTTVDAGGISWIKDTGATAIVPRESGWYVMSNWRFSDLSAGVAWSSASLGRWAGVKRTYMPFAYYPSLAQVGGGGTLLTFPSTSAAGAPSVATSLDGVSWATTALGADGVGALRGGVEGNGRIVVVGNKGQIYYSSDGPPAIARQPQTQTVTAGGRASLSVTAYATGPFTYQWRRNGVAIPGATGESFTLNSAAVSDSGDYSVSVANGRGVVLSALAALTVKPLVAVPVIVSAPASRVITQGAVTQLTVDASGTPSPSFQWYKDGQPILGATGATYAFTGNGSASGGAYTVVASNSAGSVTSAAASVRVIPTNRLANLSVRTALENGQTLIVGAVVAEGTKALLLRAAGPALNQFGLSGLPDPAMDLYTGGTTPAASNEDWSASLAPLFQTAGAFGFVVGSRDAALSPTLGGAFTVQVKGAGRGSVLVEAYDLGSTTTPRLVNLSARHWVGTGADVLIAGFVLAGSGTKQVLIRAVGPTLTNFGVAGALVDPQLEVLDGSGRVLGSNDNWSSSLSATFSQVGAFPLATGSRDAATLITLPAGTGYTVKVSGANNTTGEALIEVYEVF